MSFKHLKKVLLIFASLALVYPNAFANIKDQHTKVVLRSIGHEFLLQMNDSTSRILPIEKREGRFEMHFEEPFAFDPDLLYYSVIKALEENIILENYIVEVEQCGRNEVIYSFKASLKESDRLQPCSGRIIPKDCYTVFFTGIESTEDLGQDSSIGFLGLNSVIGLLSLLFAGSLFFWLNKKKKVSRQNSDLIDIGKYQFNKKRMTLTLKEESVELSSKETDLLLLLCSNENKTLERKYILHVIWGDEGDYVGRTLDVFISKLRKKLEGDARLKIVNVRGVGYRFVIH